MDAEQESRWLEAQGIGVGEDLVPAALRQLEFLAAVDRRRWLYEGALLERAIHRYKTCWLPLLAKHTQATVVDGPLVVPLDCEWIWHCHRLNPVQYIKDCKRLYGRILNNSNVESSIRTNSKHQTEKVWTELYPKEPFNLEYTSPSDNLIYANAGAAGDISYDLVSAVKRQTTFCYQVGTPTMHDPRFLEEALARYKGFLYLIKKNQENKMKLFRVPTYDVDLMWHTHQLHPATYCDDMLKLLGRVLEHDDTDDDRSEGKKLDVGFSETTEQFQNAFGLRYWKAGAMYRGNMPSSVTSIPQIFSKEAENDFDATKAEKRLSVLETTVVELFLEIVDIKNLPSAIPKENVYIWFTKNQSDMFISDGGRLDISTRTGKSTGAGIQCEPTGELILTVLVDRASSSKKPEPIGKVSISLQEFTQPDSKLSFERWLELKPHDGRACSPAVSLRVAASTTVPVKAQQVLSMIRTEPFFLKTFLLPPSIKDQKMSCWTRFEYDCGTELIRLRTRDHKPKKDMAILRELVGVTKSSKKPFTLAEFKENKWSLSNSNLLIPADFKPSKDGSILELQIDNKLIKLYQGRRLEYGPKCCNHHAEDGSAVTAVKFSAKHPYGKAIALLDTDSELIMVNEDGFLLPWIVMSFLFLDTNGKDGTKLNLGTMVQKAAMLETVKDAPAQCGTLVPDNKTGHARGSDMAIANDTEADAKCGDCGSGCGGGCGPVITVSSKEGHGIAVTGSGGNEHAEFAGCGSGCGGGVMVREYSKANDNCGSGVMTHESSKAAGCGSGCGGGCGGGVMVHESSMASGCGSGCGGGCGNMVNESSKASGCGSGCGGGCGNMVNESCKAGGCGSGCGGGCGSMVSESSKTGGCGSGCGGGCGNMVRESSKPCGCGSGCGGGCGGGVMVHESSKAGGCGSGCSGGCGNMVRESYKAGGCGSGCGGGCGSGIMAHESSKASGCGSGCGGGIMVHESSKAGGCGSGCGGGCGGGIMARESSKAGGCGSGCGGGCGGGIMIRESSKASGCGSGCGGGCGSGIMVRESSKAGGCGSGCGGGCGGGIMVRESSKASGGGSGIMVRESSKAGGCGSGCGGGCGGGMMVRESSKASGCGSGCGGGCGNNVS